MSAAQSAADLQVSGVVPETRATVPLPAAMAMVPVASAVGRATVPPVPAAWATRYRPPGAIDPVRAETCHCDPAEGLPGRYWTLRPPTSKGAEPALASSTKSRVSVAPELPPPPYTSEMTAVADGAAWAAGRAVTASAAATAPVSRTEPDLCICTGGAPN